MKFKHIFTGILATIMTLSGVSAFAAAESIIIDGQAAEIPADMGSIKEMDDRTFVPIRFVLEYLGCHVDWDDSNHAATVTTEDCADIIQENNPILFKIPYTATESINLSMDTVPFIDLNESRMYIPIRFLAEAIGYTVGWDEVTQTVTLTGAE